MSKKKVKKRKLSSVSKFLKKKLIKRLKEKKWIATFRILKSPKVYRCHSGLPRNGKLITALLVP
jgi:hypothetical protein